MDFSASTMTFTSMNARKPVTVTVRDNRGKSIPDARLTWASENPSVAAVSGQGRSVEIVAMSPGSTNIRVTSGSAQATLIVSVFGVRSVQITPPNLSMRVGESVPVSALVNADAGVPPDVSWSTGNAAIATVNADGIVTAVGPGSTTLQAAAVADPRYMATGHIAVAPHLGVVVSPTALSLGVAETQTISATVSIPGSQSTAVSWSSSNPSVASVNAQGAVTAVAVGNATITATSVADPSLQATAQVSVVTRLATSWSATRLNGALYEDVLSLYAVSDADAFAVNVMGDIYRSSGSTWTRVLAGSASGTSFRAVHGTSATDVFAVGTNGRIFRWQGSAWTAMTSGTGATLNAVYATDEAVFAVGENGTTLRFNGSTWTTLQSGSTRKLRAVWASGNVAVAVGDNGEVLRFNGTAWSRQVTPTQEDLHGVAGLSPTDVVAAGDFGTIVRYNGSSWSTVWSGVTADLMAVTASPVSERVFVAGSFGTVLELVGNTPTVIEAPYATRFYAAATDGAGELWTAGQRGVVQRRSSSTWSVRNLAPDLIDVWSTSATSAFAVGEFGFIYRWNGSSWTRQDAPTRERLNTVWATSAGDAFAGGDGGVMLRWNGSAWNTMSFPSGNDVLALWGTSSTNVFAVTFGGEVMRFDGSAWARMHSQGNSLYGVFGSGPNDVYAIGDAGTVLRFDGSGWLPRHLNAPALLVGLWASGPANVVTVGLSPNNPTLGAAYRYDGSSWAPSFLSMAAPELTSIWGPTGTDLYATGGAGTILRFNGSTWQAMSSGTNDYLWTVTGAPTGQGGAFAVGYNTTVVTGSNASGAFAAAGIASALAQDVTTPTFDPSLRSRPAQASVEVPDGAARHSLRQMHTRRSGSR